MTRRLPVSRLLLVLLLPAALIASTAGCAAFTTAMYLMGANDIPAEFKGLKGKKVAVVCRPVASVAFRDTGAAQDLAREVNRLLAKNVAKVQMVDQQKVAAWVDERYDGDYSFTEAGEAFDADMVVGIELQEFSLHMGQTLYQGKANVRFVVHDMRDGQRVVFDRELPQIAWPPNGGIETSERQESLFRSQFIRVVSDQVGRYFYAHDPASNFAI
ncbi:MAG: hypothetical protein U1E05_06825, partial [Patescibacteria group bacterium]|nr:hypothetical protein [Patescibacteria group bacterium]